jgi:hypothetical protein
LTRGERSIHNQTRVTNLPARAARESSEGTCRRLNSNYVESQS